MKTLNITNTEELNEFERIKQNVNYEETEIIIDVRFIYEFAGYMGMGPITFGNRAFKIYISRDDENYIENRTFLISKGYKLNNTDV